MKIIISPAKTMSECDYSSTPGKTPSLPSFLSETEKIREAINSLSIEEQQEVWKCNDELTKVNHERFANMEPRKVECLSPAVFCYEGIQYKTMDPKTLDEEALEYLQEHLRILSGFYGILKPLDGITPYRLEMQAKLKVEDAKNLYDFWGKKLAEALGTPELIINLASNEYSKAVAKHLKGERKLVTIMFGENKDGKFKQKATLAKMARGAMVRFMAKNKVKSLEELKQFSELDLSYSEELSTDDKLVFCL